MRRRLMKGLFVAALAIIAAGRASAQPANDNFANATVVAGLPFNAAQGIMDATVEANDPDQFGRNRTVWYRFTPAVDTFMAADTFGSNYDTTLGAYTGPHESLSLVTKNDDTAPNGAGRQQSQIYWLASGGTTYHIMVGAFGANVPAGGNLAIRFRTVSGPANDMFANAVVIPGLPFADVPRDTEFATTEPGEPVQTSSQGREIKRTVWYRYTSPQTMVVKLDAGQPPSNSTFNVAFAVYTGNWGSLTTIGQSTNSFTNNTFDFIAQAGVTYHIRAGAEEGPTNGILRFSARAFSPPPHDDFDNAKIITEPLPYYDEHDTLGSLPAADDPAYAGGRPTVWYRYTPTEDMLVGIDTYGSSVGMQLAAYSGQRGALTELARTDNTFSVMALQVQAGHTYYIMAVVTPGSVNSGRLGGLMRIRVGRKNVKYAVTEIPFPEGTQSISPLDINNDGTFVGSVSIPGTGNGTRGAVWVNGVPAIFGVLGPPSGNRISQAFGINEFGIVVGRSSSSAGDRAVIFNPDGTLTNLGVLGNPPTGNPSSLARAINNRGEIVGQSSTPAGTRAFSWFEGVMSDLGVLGPPATGLPTSSANAINGRGMIVGSSSSPNGTRAALWYKGGITDLGVIGPSPSGTSSSTATAINNAGQIVGSSTSPESNGNRAFFWDSGELINLGLLPVQNPSLSQSWRSSALSINSGGVIVGDSTDFSSSSGRGAIWRTKDLTAEDLNDLLPGFPDIIVRASRINDNGVILVEGTLSIFIPLGPGFGTATSRKYLLTPLP